MMGNRPNYNYLHEFRHAEFISVSVIWFEVQILKQVQDDGDVFRMTELCSG